MQLDGSFHAWFEQRVPTPLCLITLVDDATSRSLGRFSDQETIWAAVDVLRLWLETYGIPQALYTDWKNVYVRVANEAERAAGVVPRTQVAPTLRFIAEVAEKHDLRISNIFHAGDGNLHPIILFDAHSPGELERARAAGEDILRYCISVGGSITGEHGVGMEKNELMGHLFSADTLLYMERFKALFDPQNGLNPGKVLPTVRGCLEIRQAPLTARTAV